MVVEVQRCNGLLACPRHRRRSYGGGRVAGLVFHQSALHNGECRGRALQSGRVGQLHQPAGSGQLPRIGGGFTTFAGGYNIIMLNKERQRADDAEARLQAERERNDKEREKREREDERQRERYERLMDEFLEERRQANEDRRQYVATQQAMMNTLAEINATLVRLAEQQNGHRSNGD